MSKNFMAWLIAAFVAMHSAAAAAAGEPALKTAHFSFFADGDIQPADIQALAESLETSYPVVSKNLSTAPAADIHVFLYAGRWRYVRATGNWGASGSIEGPAKLHFLMRGRGESDPRKIAVHEFTHAVLLQLLINQEQKPLDTKAFDAKFAKFPVWLFEALSVYEAGEFVDPNSLPYLKSGVYPQLRELSNRSQGGKIYEVGYTIVEYILARYSREKLHELILNYGDVPRSLNVSEQEFSKGWRDFLQSKYLH